MVKDARRFIAWLTHMIEAAWFLYFSLGVVHDPLKRSGLTHMDIESFVAGIDRDETWRTEIWEMFCLDKVCAQLLSNKNVVIDSVGSLFQR